MFTIILIPLLVALVLIAFSNNDQDPDFDL